MTTNTGQKIDDFTFDTRTIPVVSQARWTLSLPLPDPGVTSLDVQLWDPTFALKVPVPAADAGYAWNPAPLRQAGLEQDVHREAGVQMVLDTIRSEGLVTEIGYRASRPLSGLSMCQEPWADQCTLTEPDGTTHPLLGATTEAPAGSRVQGTLRFLGEINPASDQLTLQAPLDWALWTSADPVTIELPSHADSPVRAVAGDLSRPAPAFTPVELTDAETGAVLRVDSLDLLADRIQAHVTGSGGTADYDFDTTDGNVPSFLAEPDGYQHPLLAPGDVRLRVPKGGSMEATLVFAGGVPADVTTLVASIGGFYSHQPATATFTIPAGDARPPSEGPTFGELGASEPTPAPTARLTPAASTPDASATPTPALVSMDITDLPATTVSVLGAVRSTVAGSALGGQVASSVTVDPDADAAAQRSLEELGAEKTPDGWVLTLPETVLFDYNADAVKPDADATLTKVAELLSYYDRVQIGVQGHTDNSGDAAYNQDLSQRRAQAVADALASKGVATGRMTVEGFGLTRPVASNDDDAGRAKNRRVEIVLRENA